MKTKLFSLLAATLVLAAASLQAQSISCESIKQRYPTKAQWQAAANIDCSKLPADQQKACRTKVQDIAVGGMGCKW